MSAAIARVFVNSVEVGSLPVEQYQEIVRQTRADKRLYVGQALSALNVLFRFLVKALLMVPVFYFFLFVLLEMGGPSNVTDFITAMRQATPAEVEHAIRMMLGWGFEFSAVLVFMAYGLGGYSTGYVDPFDVRIAGRIRSLLEVPAEGVLTVEIPKNAKQ
jgi:hypothetical protein